MDEVKRQRDEALRELDRIKQRLAGVEALVDTVQAILNRARA